ncbi:MAG TPA: hypothetical protein VGD91_24350 [Trebonia sp.]
MSRQVLSRHFEPGFDLAPERFTALEAALERARADLRVTGLPGPARLAIPEWSPHAFVAYQGGHGGTSGIAPADGRDAVSALLAVAGEAQDAVMEALRRVWPVCPAQALGVHARERSGVPGWWCAGDGGHVAAAIGQWAG